MPRVIPPPSLENICGSVVTYWPDERFPANLRPLLSSLSKWLVVDNGSGETTRDRLRALASDRVELIENSENLGVATALNQAARRARALGFDWLLTFDQDSEPADGMLDGLLYACRAFKDCNHLGMLGTNFLIEGLGNPFFPCKAQNDGLVEMPTVITSGSLLSLSAYEDVGAFREDLFIDGVDSEYCLRLRGAGYVVALTCMPLMRHSLGHLRVHWLLWKKLLVTHHSALRRYYITRNGIVIAARYWRREAAWARTSLWTLGIGFAGVVLFERPKLRKIGAALLGVVDAIRGRRGKATARWLSP